MKRAILLMLFLAFTATKPADATNSEFIKAITIGSGPKTVVEFTDPDCPYCRKASKYFEGRSDVTRHIFFYPLPTHPKAKEKIQYVLSQQDKAKAYHMVMSGTLDRRPKLETNSRGIKLQEEQLEIARKHNIDSTPTFLINGRIIEGFDQKKIEDALGPKKD
jgi:thiol:disulfide interchange protein DsbC